jgi:two-component system nitrogen regulation sensor histidine kinase NtrY
MNIIYSIFLRICGMIFFLIVSFFLYYKQLIYSSIFAFLILGLLLFALFIYLKNIFNFYNKTIDAILKRDFTSDFTSHKWQKSYKELFKLYNQMKENQNEIVSKELVFNSIFNNIETGIIILKKQDLDWNIYLINNYFTKHFMVPKVSKWFYLKNFIPKFCDVIEQQNFKEIKTSLQIRVNQEDTQTFILQTSRSTSFDQEYYIILLDSIQKVIEKKEKEAWINLMKVISHEMFNSLAPIQSLSQNLYQIIHQENLTSADIVDIKSCVDTIIKRSVHLQKFVDSYRKIAMLPSPERKPVNIKTLIINVLNTMMPVFKNNDIIIHNQLNFNKTLQLDQNQIEQVLINLITNSVFATKGIKQKNIYINGNFKDKRVFITISDSGKGIEQEIEEKIFLPFFTTRKDGAGIGLTLSKSIIEAHGGYLIYQNYLEKTTFTICLIDD